MNDDLPPLLATVNGVDYFTGVLAREPEQEARFYSTIAAWPTTQACQLATLHLLHQTVADLRVELDATRDREALAHTRNADHEITIRHLRSQLDAPDQGARPDPTLPRLDRHTKIPCGVAGCADQMALGTSMSTHRRRKHPTWYAAQQAMSIDDPRYVSNRGGPLFTQPAPEQSAPERQSATPAPTALPAPAPLPPAPPVPPDVSEQPAPERDQQRRMLKHQFATLDPPFLCAVCGESAYAQSLSDTTRCQRCVKENRQPNGHEVAAE